MKKENFEVYSLNEFENSMQLPYSKYIVLLLFLPAIKYYIINSIPGLFQYNIYANYILGVIFLISFVRLLPSIVRNKSSHFFTYAFILFMIYLVTFLIGGDNWKNLLNASVDIILVSFSLYCVSRRLKNADDVYHLMCKYAPIVIILSLLYFISTIVFHRVASDGTSYDMSSSYFCLVPTVICFSAIGKEKGFFYSVFFVIGVVVCLALGSRGALVGIAFFVALYTLKKPNRSRKDLFIIAVVIIVCVFLIIDYSMVMSYFNDLLTSIGIKSRTLDRLVSGSFIRDKSNRNIISNEMLGLIREHPFGVGFMGELRCHNILLENILWFGWIPGFLLNFFFVVVAYFIIFRMDFSQKSNLVILAVAAYALPDALLNLTVWGKDFFWVMVGLMISYGFSNAKIRFKVGR